MLRGEKSYMNMKIMKYIGLGLLPLVCSCGGRDRQVEEALSLSGNNRNELEAVLKHYEGDGRKLEAARFLIGNMPGSYGANPIVEQDCSAFYEAYDSLGQKYDYRVGTEWGKQVDSLWKDFSNRHRVRQELNYDITRMKAEDLIREIDLAFRAWVENVHSRNCSFEDFCEYILPYRRQNGLLIDNARREFNKRHQGKYFVKEGKDVLHLSFSSGLSGTANSMRMAAEELSEEYPERKILAVDTLCACMGEGLLLHKALQLKAAGKTMEEVAQWVDVIFTATPQGLCASLINEEILSKTKIIDLSADFRLKDVKVYEEWYKIEHKAPQYIDEAVYGLCEINRDKVKDARIVANPGCYTTCSILTAYPLAMEGLIDMSTLIIDAKSGTSGAGRGAKLPNLYCEVNENIKAYGVATHRHTPEIEEQLGYAAGEKVVLNFTPHLVPMNRGILATEYAKLTKEVTYEEVKAIYDKYYADEKFVRVLEKDQCPETKWVEGSNYVDIGFKISDELIARSHNNPDGKLILVTAINPTPAGEGKTTVTVGLGQAFAKLGKKAMIALREPSLGPCFGIKGGAAGGGYSQVVPMEDLNLHFTGDFHAITSANNLLAALLDNHIQQGNTLGIDPRQVVWKRCLDMNDRVLRNVVVGLGNKMDGMVREDHFVITVASEIMAILCLAEDMKDLKRRLGRIIVAYTFDGKPVTAEDLQAVGSMAALLKDALKPNLIQTLEHTPALVHGGPFANIAHGCNSVRATTTALKLADYVITEAGFGADLGAEKFFDIKCRKAGLHPDAVVLVATIRALKYNGGVLKDELSNENLEALKKGIVNLEKHIENLQKFGVPVVVTLNAFVSDTEAETAYVEQFCKEHDCEFALAKVWEKGGEGGIALANKILETLEKKESHFHTLYSDDLGLKEKIETVAKEIYGADGVTYSPAAERELKRITDLGMANFPVCMAKTQYSLSDDAKKLGRPTGFKINVREVYVSAGAGFVVAVNGSIMTLPGLPKKPAAYGIDVNDDGVITGLF